MIYFKLEYIRLKYILESVIGDNKNFAKTCHDLKSAWISLLRYSLAEQSVTPF